MAKQVRTNLTLFEVEQYKFRPPAIPAAELSQSSASTAAATVISVAHWLYEDEKREDSGECITIDY